VASEVDVAVVGVATKRVEPDAALVALGASSQHALDLIEEIVHQVSCPVIALLESEEPGYVREAAQRGVFAYIVDSSPSELQSTIDVALQRFAEYRNLHSAFGRRAVIEQAKGILMARHGVDADRAFALLRDHSQQTGQRLVDVASGVIDLHLLLDPAPKDLTPGPVPDDGPGRGAHNPGTRVPSPPSAA
jgi:AmiR/NasT family two-component response regulator